MKVRVFVPGTSANLGAGFDVFGLAVNLHNEFCVESSDKFEITLKSSQGEIPSTKENLFYKSFAFLFEKFGQPVPDVHISMNLQVRQGRGFGSSATAVVGGLVAANAFLYNEFSKDQLLPFAVELERGKHPDNVAPALFGGLVVATKYKSEFIHVKIPLPSDFKAVFFIPDFTMDTVTGRKMMPDHYSKEEVVFNTSRVALFLAALQTKKYALLRTAMEDVIHQPARAKIFPPMQLLIDAANNAGALGAALSGGGSAIIALANENFQQIGDAMKEEAERHKITGVAKKLEILNEGVFLSCDEVVNEHDRPLLSFADSYPATIEQLVRQ
jgi:homoserine kinase